MRQFKKVATSSALLVSLVMTGVLPVFAADNKVSNETTQQKYIEPKVPADMMQKEQAIAKARAMFDGLENFKFANANYEQSYGMMQQSPVWFINFLSVDPKNMKLEHDSAPMESYFVVLDAKSGELINFHHQNPDWVGDQNPSEDTATQTATAFMEKILPDLHAKVKIAGINGGGSATTSAQPDGKKYKWTYSDVSFYQVVNGIPFRGNSVQVEVDQYGHVVGVNRQFNFDSSKLPSPENVIPLETAESTYAKQIEMQKSYMSTWYKKEGTSVTSVNHPALMYSPKYLAPIDAISGKLVENPYVYEQNQTPESIQVNGSGEFVAKDKEDAKQLVAKVLNVDLSSLNFREEKRQGLMNDSNDIWSFTWVSDPQSKDDSHLFVNANFDAKTGQLLNVNKQVDSDKVKQTALSVMAGETKAVNALQKLLPTGTHDLLLLSSFAEKNMMSDSPAWYDKSKAPDKDRPLPNVYNYRFVNAYQGVPIMDQGMFVQIDATTGGVSSLSFTPQVDVKLPDNRNTISEDQAKDVYLKEHPLHLEYTWDRFRDQTAPTGRLMYTEDYESRRYSYIDALTGQLVVIDQK